MTQPTQDNQIALDAAKREAMSVFEDSAAMPGNEKVMEAALDSLIAAAQHAAGEMERAKSNGSACRDCGYPLYYFPDDEIGTCFRCYSDELVKMNDGLRRAINDHAFRVFNQENARLQQEASDLRAKVEAARYALTELRDESRRDGVVWELASKGLEELQEN